MRVVNRLTVMCVPDWILADPAPAKMNKEDENDEE